LSQLDLLVCQSSYKTAVTELAHVILPTALPPEKEGAVISVTGARQALRRVMARPAGVRSDGEILHEIVRILGRTAEVFPEPDVTLPAATRRQGRHPESIAPAGKSVIGGSALMPPLPSPEFPFHLLPVPSLFGDSLLNRQSPEIEALKNGLTVVMGNDDFAAQGWEEKDAVLVRTPFGAARATVVSSARVKRGTALLRSSAGNRDGLALLRPGYAAVPAAVEKVGKV
jgi:anaerobic selenocysteine-containing dehydrogenase